MALQRLWSKAFYDSVSEDMQPRIKATAISALLGLLTVVGFGVLFFFTDRVQQSLSMAGSAAVFLSSLFLLANSRFLAGRLLLLLGAAVIITVIVSVTGVEFGAWVYLLDVMPLALVIFSDTQKSYYRPIIVVSLLALGICFVLPTNVDLGNWYHPYPEGVSRIMMVVNTVNTAIILLSSFFIVMQENRKRKEAEQKALAESAKRREALEAQTKSLESAKLIAEQAEKEANEHANELAQSQFKLEEAMDRMKEREREVAQKNEELQASEEEMRQSLEELEVSQEQMQSAQKALSLKDEIYNQSIMPIAAGTSALLNANAAFYHDLLGYDSESEIVGKRLRELAPEYQHDGRSTSAAAKELERRIEENDSTKLEWLFERKDGSTVLTELRINKLNVDDEKYKGGLLLIGEDITHRKQQEAHIRAQTSAIETNEKRLKRTVTELESARQNERFLGEFNDILRWREDDELERWADRIIEAIVPELGVVQLTFYIRNYKLGDQTERAEEDQTPTLKYLTGYAQPQEYPEEIEFGEGLMGQVARTGRAFEYRQNGRSRKRRIGRVQSGMLAMRTSYSRVQPISYNKDVVGTIELTAIQALSDTQLHLLEEISTRVGAALATLRNQFRVRALYEEAQKNAQRLKQQELELRQNIEQLNTAQEEMKRAQSDVSKLNDELEERVQQRTSELEQAMSKVESTQSQLIMSEKMAALGQLVAGIAHEINSPLGAIKASSSTMQDIMPTTITDLPTVLMSLNPDQLDMFNKMVYALLEGEPQNLTSKEERQLRKDYQAEMEAAGIADARKLSKDIVGAGFQGNLEPYMPLFNSDRAKLLADLLYNLGQLNVNLANINLAADKTNKVVFALKSYAHRSDKDELAITDVKQNIETVLTIYHNQIKYGIELTSNLKEVPPVKVNPDEISQVWTNLLQNAIQAMNSEGELLVECYQEGDYVVVAVQDAGPGIPPHIQEKIFEPFFTTKKKGEGTGLGLDICKKIVEKFGGDLSFESEPGRTRFETRLPIASEAEAQA